MRPDLLDLVRRLLEEEEPFARATVVRRRPPTSSRLGDTAVITRDGELHGWIGGSCTTPEVVRQALEAIREGAPRLLAFGFDEVGPGDESVVRVPMTCQSGGSVEVYIEPMIPAPRLLVAGTSPISRALVRIGSAMGWSVLLAGAAEAGEFPEADVVVDSLDDLPEGLADRPESLVDPEGLVDRPEGLVDRPEDLVERPEGSRLFALVATMGRADERTVLRLLELRPDYVGVIASPKRMSEIRDRLEEHGVEEEVLASLRGPAGLDLGGTTPEEIAISVLAEMVQEHRKAGAGAADTDVAAATAAATTGGENAGADPTGGDTAESDTAGADTAESDTAGADTAESDTTGPGTTGPGTSAWAEDPVCGMTVEADGSRPTFEHEGTTYHFCCEGCRDRFGDEPDAFLENGAAAGGSA